MSESLKKNQRRTRYAYGIGYLNKGGFAHPDCYSEATRTPEQRDLVGTVWDVLRASRVAGNCKFCGHPLSENLTPAPSEKA